MNIFGKGDVSIEKIPGTKIENIGKHWIILQSKHHLVEILTLLKKNCGIESVKNIHFRADNTSNFQSRTFRLVAKLWAPSHYVVHYSLRLYAQTAKQMNDHKKKNNKEENSNIIKSNVTSLGRNYVLFLTKPLNHSKVQFFFSLRYSSQP